MSDKKDWININGELIKISSIVRVSKVRKEVKGDVEQYSQNPINVVFGLELSTGSIFLYEEYSNILFHNGGYYNTKAVEPDRISGDYWETSVYKQCVKNVSEFRDKLIDML